MLKYILSIITMFMLVGCGGSNGFMGASSGDYSTFHKGVIKEVREVEIGDNGTGTVIGALAGGLLGNQFGKGNGKVAATVVGAGAGAYAGNQINKDKGQELTIVLENGTMIKEVNKGNAFRPNDYVMLEFGNGKVVNITLVNQPHMR